MSCVKIYGYNLVREAISVTPSTENSQYPATNIQDDFRSKVFRSTTNSDSVIFDFGTEEVITACFLVPSDEGFGFSTMTLELNATADFSSPAFSTSITINNAAEFAKATFAEQNYRFARLVATSTQGFIEISKVFIGTSGVDYTSNDLNFGWQHRNNDIIKVGRNEFNQEFIDEITRQKEVSGNFTLLNRSEYDDLNDMIKYNGLRIPLWFYLSEDILNDPDEISGYYRFSQIPRFTNNVFRRYDTQVSFREAK